jgi:two-component system response regulator FixJ
MSPTPTVFVVDDDEAVRESLVLLLETAGFFSRGYANGRVFLEDLGDDNHHQGCVILDVHMPDLDGPAVQQALMQRGIRLPVIFLTAYGSIPMSVQAIKAGAVDFLTKPVEGAVLLARVREAVEQSARQQEHSALHDELVARLRTLTAREQDVMKLAVTGLSNKEIAQRLAISHRTVEIHRARVMHKTGASSLLELARMAESADWPHPD